jgi:hypothetical protein
MVSGIGFVANFHEILDFAILYLIVTITDFRFLISFKKAKIWGALLDSRIKMLVVGKYSRAKP